MNIIETINNWGKGSYFQYGLLETIFFIVLFIIISKLLVKIINKAYKRHLHDNQPFIQKMIKIIIYVICGYACLSLLPPFKDVLGTLWGSAGIIALIIGFAAQEAMGNLVNGMLIATFKPFKIGDLVRINQGEYEGYVVDISLRDTTIKTYENTLIKVPNSVMNKEVLENINQDDSYKVNFLYIQISYESDIDQAIAIIQKLASNHPLFLPYPNNQAIPVLITNFADSGIELRASILSNNQSEGFSMLCDLRKAIKEEFDKAGIIFPYPHRSVEIINKH